MLLNLTWTQKKINLSNQRFLIISFLSKTLISTALIYSTLASAQSISYGQAEQSISTDSYSTQANQALQQASKLQAEALKGLGLPRVDLNVRAYAFHNKTDLDLDSFKNNLEQTLSQGINDRIDQENFPPNISDPLKEGIHQTIHNGVGLFPDSANVILEDQVVRPTVSILMPLYTGGLTSSSKEVANIQAKRSQLTSKQQQDVQRFEMIQVYFNTQLQQQLLQSNRSHFNAMQIHYRNAIKLEQQGFISKGQRMQFEVAQNNAERAYQNTEGNFKASLFQLNNLLQTSQITDLSTPLFINSTQNQTLNSLLKTYQEQSALIRKMQMDTQLANANVKVHLVPIQPIADLKVGMSVLFKIQESK